MLEVGNRLSKPVVVCPGLWFGCVATRIGFDGYRVRQCLAVNGQANRVLARLEALRAATAAAACWTSGPGGSVR